VLGALPGGAAEGDHPPCDLGEGWHGPAALLDQGISTGADCAEVEDGLMAGFGQGNVGPPSQAELAAAAVDDDALDPSPGAGGVNLEVEAVAVCVQARAFLGADLGRG
jgi:hypothetical protein